MLKITHEAASAAILTHVDEGRLTQAQWHGKGDDGRKTACLLGSMHPKVKTAADCNGDLMPMWLAELTPTLFDGLPTYSVYPIARRYGELVGRWRVLSAGQWDTILKNVLVRCIDDAVNAARPASEGKPYWPAVEAACEQSKAVILSGDKAAARAAEAAARAASAAAGAAARAAEAAARAAARAAAEAAAWAAAEAAAGAAAWAAGAAAEAAEAAAEAAVYLSLFNFVLDQIEAEINNA